MKRWCKKLRLLRPTPRRRRCATAHEVDPGRRSLTRLHAAGVEICDCQPTMFHVKVMIVDAYLVSVGSTNFDDRSFHLNDESNFDLYDRAFAQEQVAVFEADLVKSKRITLQAWKRR